MLLPKTRGGNSEIVLTTILESLGILAPRTRFIKTKMNNIAKVMLFQEKVSKEFLEHFQRREGPIFEGDERFIWGFGDHRLFSLERISLARLVNEKWAAKGPSSLRISLSGFSLLQTAYQQYINDVPEICGNGSTFIDPDILASDNGQTYFLWQLYEVTLMAANATHALRPHNRKFFFNALQQSLEPIYYDGGANFNKSLDRNHYECQLHQIIPNYSSSQLKRIMKRIDQLDADEVYKPSIGRGYTDSKSQFETAFEKFTDNALSAIQMLTEKEALPPNPKIIPSSQQLLDNVRTVDGVVFSELHTRVGYNEQLLRICDPTKDCQFKTVTQTDLIKLMTGEKPPQIDYDNIVFWGETKPDAAEIYNRVDYNPSLTLLTLGKVYSNYNEETRTLNISLESPEARAMITNSDLTNVEILVKHMQPKQPPTAENQRFNAFALTGCLTIYQTQLDNLSIKANAMGCEDGVNIISSRGSISSILVTRAISDAVDLDFSNLTIGEIQVRDAGNDCVDFSGGNYKVDTFILEQCGDKAVSVGEKSKLSAGLIRATNSEIGVSSKDTSRVFVSEIIGEGLKTCMEAYNKKTEFNGGEIFVDDASCNGSPVIAGPNSTIVVNSQL